MEKNTRRKRRRRRSRILLFTIMAVILLALAGAYMVVSAYYEDRFFPGTYINGIDCAGMTVQEVEQIIANRAEDFVLTIYERDGKTEQIDGPHMGYEYLSDGSVQAVKDAQKDSSWLYAFFHPELSSSNVITVYDKEMLREAMLDLDCFDPELVVTPQDAYIEETDTSYRLVEEVEGNELDEDKVFELLTSAVDNGETEVNLEESGCYKEPSVRSDDEALNNRYNTLVKYSEMSVTYVFGDEKEVLDSETIISWMTIEDDGSVSFNWNMAADWLAELGDKYNTIGTTQPFTTSLGETVMVLYETYGWKIDEANEIDELLAILQAAEPTEREPLYLETANSRGEGENDIGDTYVEIDYTNQRMWFYKDGVCLVDTPIVTGDISQNMGSPTGVYCIYNKEQNATLEGEDYKTPVDFWMPFYGGVGIHDAKWRSSFGGTIYQTNGSHGCINTPWDQAQIIFNNISIGDPVVCYNAGVNQGNASTTVEQPDPDPAADENGNILGSEDSAQDSTADTGSTDSTADTGSTDGTADAGSTDAASDTDSSAGDSTGDTQAIGEDWPTEVWNGEVTDDGVIVIG